MKRELVDYDTDSHEADIKFSVENNSIIVYCPYLAKPKLKCEYGLTAFLPSNITRTCNKRSIIKNNDGYYSYAITAKLIERAGNNCKVSVKGLIIGIDDVPNDMEIGENVVFDTIRIDYNPL